MNTWGIFFIALSVVLPYLVCYLIGKQEKQI